MNNRPRREAAHTHTQAEKNQSETEQRITGKSARKCHGRWHRCRHFVSTNESVRFGLDTFGSSVPFSKSLNFDTAITFNIDLLSGISSALANMPSIYTRLSAGTVTRKRRSIRKRFQLLLITSGDAVPCRFGPSSANRMWQECYIIKCFFVFESVHFYSISRRYFRHSGSNIGTVFPRGPMCNSVRSFSKSSLLLQYEHIHRPMTMGSANLHSEFLIGRMQFD